MNKITNFMDKFFFFGVVLVAFLVFFCDTVISYQNKDWWMLALNASLSAMVAQAYLFDWRKKI